MAKKEEKDRSKDRRKRGNRKYGQAKLKHAKKGISSCVVAGIVFLLMIVLVIVAYRADGTVAGYVGGLGVCTMMFSVIGVNLARRGFKEREKDYLTCKIGMACNLLFLLTFIGIFCWGLF